jgi:transcriptional regulator with XRE-family HTH domain
MVFVKRQLEEGPQTLGEKLRLLRRGQAVSLDMMERDTHIQRCYLIALERGRYEDLPEPMYARNFIRSYARVLGADETYLLELYEDECGRCDLVGPMQTPRQKVRSGRLVIWNRYVRLALLLSVIGAVTGYFGWQVSEVLAPPEIVLLTPEDQSLTRDAVVTVSGLVDGEATVYINGQPVVVDSDATFSADIDLQAGLNVISIEAERRYSRRTFLERYVVFDPLDRVVIK